MTPKERRDRLLTKRPFIRPLQIYDDGNYHKDMAILWASNLRDPFKFLEPGLSQERFASEIEKLSSQVMFFIVEDENESFESKRGPVALISVVYDGWRAEPHVIFFAWSTKRNKLRVTVCFLQWLRYKKIGVILVWSDAGSKILFHHCEKYGVLHFVGTIPNGGSDGDEYIFSMKGKREVEDGNKQR